MTPNRTGGMTAIGILNIVFGSLGSLFSLLVLLGGGIIAASGTAAGSSGTTAAAGGGLIMLVGLVFLACWATLVFAGIGVMKMTHWGRTLSIVCGGVIALLQLVSFVTTGFNFVGLIVLAYGAALVGLFMQPAWRDAFAPSASSTSSSTTSQSDQYRRAA
jgi:hypothetical protein